MAGEHESETGMHCVGSTCAVSSWSQTNAVSGREGEASASGIPEGRKQKQHMGSEVVKHAISVAGRMSGEKSVRLGVAVSCKLPVESQLNLQDMLSALSARKA